MKIGELYKYQTCKQECAEIMQNNPGLEETLPPDDLALFRYLMNSDKSTVADVIAGIEGALQRNIQLRDEMELYIATVADPLIQEILLYHCAMGYSWKEIAKHLGGKYEPEALEHMAEQYLNENP